VTRAELEHAIRAACDVAGDDEVIVFGSQAILAKWPDAPEPLRMSIEVDMVPKNHPGEVDRIDGALGELSQFHQSFGFYVHGVPITAAVLPDGWERRLIRVSNSNTRGMAGLCVESHDLAASKLVAFREKDRDFVRVLLSEGMISPPTLVSRVRRLPINSELRGRLLEWIRSTERELKT
jgi:hypothetical protein